MGFPQLNQAPLSKRAERDTLFWNTLKHYTRKGRYQRPPGKAVVFDVACGTAEEALGLACFFSSGIPGTPTPQCELYLVEQDPRSLEAALHTLAAPQPERFFSIIPKVQCVAGDASDLGALPLPSLAHFILMRHQFIAHDRDHGTDIWGKMFEGSIAKLASGGLLLVTSFSKMEHDWALERIQAIAEAKVICQEENPHQISLPDPRPIAGDKFVILVKK